MDEKPTCPSCGATYPHTELMPDGSVYCHREGRIVVEGDATEWPDDDFLDSGSEPPAPTPAVLLSTTFEIPGYETVAFHGEVFGLVVRSRNVISRSGATAKAIVGGELRGMTRLLALARNDALRRLRMAADEKGANAVVGVRYDSGEIGDTANEVVAYGTAVTVREIRPTTPDM